MYTCNTYTCTCIEVPRISTVCVYVGVANIQYGNQMHILATYIRIPLWRFHGFVQSKYM